MSTPMMSHSALRAVRPEIREAQSKERYLYFGEFQVDLLREELFRQGSRVRVPAKVFQVLLALIERPGEIVSRDTLRARLWPGGTFVNYDANVNTTVNKLRLALEDSPDNPVYIETIPRQGYSFLAEVERSNEAARTTGVLTIAPLENETAVKPQSASLATPEMAVRRKFDTLFSSGWAAALLLGGVLLGAGIVLFMHRPS
jgi:DNA-binding winged helix-turn-helix (wHTH) protein